VVKHSPSSVSIRSQRFDSVPVSFHREMFYLMQYNNNNIQPLLHISVM